jgi:cleavage stimulation factor subunit 3
MEESKANEKIEKLEKKLAKNPGDIDTWKLMLQEAADDIEFARSIHERIVEQFPSSASCWLSYLDFEMQNKDLEKVEKLFSRCLNTVLNVDLYRSYIEYIKKINAAKPDAEEVRNILIKAYEFAVNQIGYDVEAYNIWADYIEFLKHGSVRMILASKLDHQHVH